MRGLVALAVATLLLTGIAPWMPAGAAHAQSEACPDGPAELELQLLGPDPTAESAFGWDVALDGDTLAIGAPTESGNVGRVHVYELRSGNWELDATLDVSVAAPAATLFGQRVAIQGDVLAASFVRPDLSVSGTGSVAVYERRPTGWELERVLLGSSSLREDAFGRDLDVHADTVLIGSPGSVNPGAQLTGAVEAHVRTPGGWALEQRFDEPPGYPLGTFGAAVAIWDGLAVIGNGDAGLPTELLTVLRRNAGTWTMEALLDDPPAGSGPSVDVEGDRIIVGGRNHARIYRHAGGSVWDVEQDLVAAAGMDFARGVGLRAPNAVVAHSEDSTGRDLPALVVFRFDGSTWTERSTLLSDPDTLQLGALNPVALDGNRAVLGTPFGLAPTAILQGRASIFACDENTPPACDAGLDLTVGCDGVQLSGSADDPDGDELAFEWTSSCADASFFPGADVLDPVVHFGDSCGLLCELTLSVDDGAGGSCADSVEILIDDLEPPALSSVPRDDTVSCDEVPAPAPVTAGDSCDPAPRLEFTEVRSDGPCPDSYSLLRTWTATDLCDNTVSATQRLEVVDERAPRIDGIPADARVDCTAVPPPVVPAVTDDCDPSPVVDFEELRMDGPCPGSYDLVRTWTATDACGNSAVAERRLEVRDTTPPVIVPNGSVEHCLWPPSHDLREFGLDDFSPTITDDCSPPLEWRFAGCRSDQPDDGRGDGHTINDCLVDRDGERLRVRAERSGRIASGRTIEVFGETTDACGNRSDPVLIGRVHVPHSASDRDDCPGDD